jgi:hypothetical protein
MRGLLVLASLVLLVVVLRALLASARRPRVAGRRETAPGGEDLVQDPVCLKYLPRSLAISARGAGETAYLCSDTCAARYRAQETRR